MALSWRRRRHAASEQRETPWQSVPDVLHQLHDLTQRLNEGSDRLEQVTESAERKVRKGER